MRIRTLLLGSLCLLICACAPAPNLTVTSSEEGVTVGVETLGEYPTTIFRARVRAEESNATLWEIEAQDDGAQVWRFRFAPGLNSVQPSAVAYGSFKVLVPTNAGEFELQPGEKYELQVWQKKDGTPLQASFSIP